MNDKKYVAIFDTNSYRDLVKGKTQEDILISIDNLKKAEKNNQILQIGILIVASEMLAHLATPLSSDYEECKNGIIAMANHCYDVNSQGIAITPPPSHHLTNSYFENLITNEMTMAQQGIQNILKSFKNNTDNAIEKYTANGMFQKCKEFIETGEENFARSIIDTIDILKEEVIIENKGQEECEKGKIEIIKSKKTLKPNQIKKNILKKIDKDEFKLRVATNIIKVILINLGITESSIETKSKAESLLNNFPIAVGFLVYITRIVVDRDIDLLNKSSKSKRWNWVWDYHVAFLISHHTIDNREVILVTRDGELTDIINKHGFTNRVMNLEQYLSFIN